MPTIRYSPSVRGFFAAGHPSIPADALEVAYADYIALLDGQATGAVIAPDAQGRPVLTTPPAPEAPPPIRRISPLAFRKRLSPASRAAVTLAAATALAAGDAQLQTIIDDLGSARLVDLDDTELAGFLATLVGAGVITAAERAALLADGTPDEAA